MANTTECDSDALVLSVTEAPLESWIVDSGASFHSTSQQELMVNYRRGNFGKVFLADGGALEIVGRGDVKILLTNGGTWTLTNVRHIPRLKRNLISVGQLDDEGCRTTFEKGTWKVCKGAMVLAHMESRQGHSIRP